MVQAAIGIQERSEHVIRHAPINVEERTLITRAEYLELKAASPSTNPKDYAHAYAGTRIEGTQVDPLPGIVYAGAEMHETMVRLHYVEVVSEPVVIDPVPDAIAKVAAAHAALDALNEEQRDAALGVTIPDDPD